MEVFESTQLLDYGELPLDLLPHPGAAHAASDSQVRSFRSRARVSGIGWSQEVCPDLARSAPLPFTCSPWLSWLWRRAKGDLGSSTRYCQVKSVQGARVPFAEACLTCIPPAPTRLQATLLASMPCALCRDKCSGESGPWPGTEPAAVEGTNPSKPPCAR